MNVDYTRATHCILPNRPTTRGEIVDGWFRQLERLVRRAQSNGSNFDLKINT
jgi:hypothetical protein